jgi:hypothetical protein
VLSLVCLGALMSGLNNSSINIALPTIVRHFNASAFQAQWLLLSFMLTNTVLMVVFGRLADILGRRELYLTGVALFTVMSAVAGFAPSVKVLIACRVLQAAAAAMLVANSAALVSAAFPRRLLGQGLGFYMASFSAGAADRAHRGRRHRRHHRLAVELLVQRAVGGRSACWWGLRVLRAPGRAADERPGWTFPAACWCCSGWGRCCSRCQRSARSAGAARCAHRGRCLFLPYLRLVYIERRSSHPARGPGDVPRPGGGPGRAGRPGSATHVAVRGGAAGWACTSRRVRGGQPGRGGAQGAAAGRGPRSSPRRAWAISARHLSARTVSLWRRSAVSTIGLLVLLLTLSATTPYWLIVVGTVVLGLGSGSFIPGQQHRHAQRRAARTARHHQRRGAPWRRVPASCSAPRSCSPSSARRCQPSQRGSIFHGTLSQVAW